MISLEVFNNMGHFIPAKVVSTTGKVIDPEHVLDNDCKWSFLGEKDTVKTFKNRKLKEEIHSVEYDLVKENLDKNEY